MKRKKCNRTDCFHNEGRTRSGMLRSNGCGLLDTVDDECSFFKPARVFKWNGKVEDYFGEAKETGHSLCK